MTETLLTSHSNHVVIVPKSEKAREKKVEQIEPPDGGSRAYLVVISAFLCNGILFGIINTYSVIYLSLQKQLKASDDEAASSKAGKLQRRNLSNVFDYIDPSFYFRRSIREMSLGEQGNVNIFNNNDRSTYLASVQVSILSSLSCTVFPSLDNKSFGFFVHRRSVLLHKASEFPSSQFSLCFQRRACQIS